MAKKNNNAPQTPKHMDPEEFGRRTAQKGIWQNRLWEYEYQLNPFAEGSLQALGFNKQRYGDK